MVYNPEEFGSIESGGWSGGETVRISPEIDVTAVATVEALPIASGTLVTKVGVLVTKAIAGAGPDIDIGDGGDPNAFFDRLGTVGLNKFLIAPGGNGFSLVLGTPDTPYVGGLLSAAVYSGKRYTSPDSIDVDVNATATTGSIRVVAWMVLPSDLGA